MNISNKALSEQQTRSLLYRQIFFVLFFLLQVGPNANVNIQVDTGDINLVTKQGKVNVNSGGDYNLKVKGNMRVAVEGNILETVEGTKTSNTSGAVIHRGSTIDLNP